MPFRNLHPTAIRLVKTCDELLDKARPDEITAEEVLESSGISKGSMYHHFEDLDDLLEITYVYRYAKWIDLTISRMIEILALAKTPHQLKKSLFEMTRLTQKDSQAGIRLERAWIYSQGHKNERFKERLVQEGERLSTSLEDLVKDVINKELFKSDLNPRVVAIFIQAYTFGVLVNDFTINRITQEEWIDFINSVIDQMFIND
ncbi:MAG: TetR/AcrR family transcriptional regulator [Actinomycetes bacterium]